MRAGIAWRGLGDPCMANLEASQANFVASVYLVGGGPGVWK